ncbi:MAG: hypothetical protein V4451_18310 [Pseudomonadota bacterium]
MGEWSDYFEQFPDEDPANQDDDVDSVLEQRVKIEATYSPEVLAELIESRTRRDSERGRLQEVRRQKRDQAQSELHRSIGGLMEAYAWLDVHVGLKIKTHSGNDPEAFALLSPKLPMKLRLDCLNKLVQNASANSEAPIKNDWSVWNTQAEKVRALRNDYAHGRWIFNHEPGRNSFRFARLDWNTNVQLADAPLAISPAEIDARSADIWALIRTLDEILQHIFPSKHKN